MILYHTTVVESALSTDSPGRISDRRIAAYRIRLRENFIKFFAPEFLVINLVPSCFLCQFTSSCIDRWSSQLLDDDAIIISC